LAPFSTQLLAIVSTGSKNFDLRRIVMIKKYRLVAALVASGMIAAGCYDTGDQAAYENESSQLRAAEKAALGASGETMSKDKEMEAIDEATQKAAEEMARKAAETDKQRLEAENAARLATEEAQRKAMEDAARKAAEGSELSEDSQKAMQEAAKKAAEQAQNSGQQASQEASAAAQKAATEAAAKSAGQMGSDLQIPSLDTLPPPLPSQ